ncbi:MAG: hypothetical protein GY795_31690 [Desulfobacterales bacterium]|nr:hypothetical protein [Desulfobacterales bacterium]
MAIRFGKPGEAFIAISRAVMCADNEVTGAELQVMDAFGKLGIFEDYEQSKEAVSDKILKAYNKNPDDETAFSKEDVDDMIRGARKVLRPERRGALFAVAALTAHTNGLDEREKVLLDQLNTGLEINPDYAKKVTDVISTGVSSNTGAAMSFLTKISQVPEIAELDKLVSRADLGNITGFLGEVAGNLFDIENDKTAKFEEPAEVFMAVIIGAISADEKYSVDEMRLVWEEIEGIDIFKGHDYRELESRVLNTFDKNLSEPSAFNHDETSFIIEAAKELLSPNLREKAFETAVKVAYADKNLEGFELGADEREKTFLNQLQEGLEIRPEVVKRLIKD